MSDSIPLPGTPESAQSFSQFIARYGMALAAWAQIEDSICYLFGILVRSTNGKMHRALFFSGRSFATRADLYSAAIATAKIPDELSLIHKALLKKARQFSSARNTIAHGIPSRLFGGPGTYEGFRIKDGDKLFETGGVSITDIETATANFIKLEELIRSFTFNQDRFAAEGATEEFLERVRALPSEAFPREADLSLGEAE